MIHSGMRTRWLLGLSALFLFALLPFSSYIVSVSQIQAEWNLSNASSGTIFSSYLLGYAASSLLMVPLTDRFSTTHVLVLGLVVMMAGHILFSVVAAGLYSACLLRAVAGAGHVAAYQAAIRVVYEQVPAQRRGSAVGFFVAAGYGGTTLSYSVTGQMLAITGSWRTAYLYVSLIGPIALLTLYFFVLHKFASHRNMPEVSGTVDQTSGQWMLDLSVRRQRPVILATLVYALHTAELYLARLWFPLLLASSFVLQGETSEAATVRAATVSGPMFMVGVIGVLSGGYISDRIGRSRSIMLIFMCSGLCSFLVGWITSSPSLLIAAGFFYGLTTAADSAILSALIVEVAPANRIGSAQAVQSFIGFLIGAAVPVMAGYILDFAVVDWRWILAFTFSGLLAVAGIAILARLANMRFEPAHST